MANFPVIPGSTLDILRRYAAPALAEASVPAPAAPAVNTPSFSERLAARQSSVPGSAVIPGSVLYPSEIDPKATTVSGDPYYDFYASKIKDYERPINRALNTANSIGDILELGIRGAVEVPYKWFTDTPEEFDKTIGKYKKGFVDAASLFSNPGSKDWEKDYWRSAINAVFFGTGAGSLTKSAFKGLTQLAKSAGQKELAKTFYKNAGELAARNAAGDFSATSAGVSKLTKQYVTQGNRALTEAEKLAAQGNSAIRQAVKTAGGTAVGVGGANAIDSTNDKTPAATDNQIKTVEQNIKNNLVAQAAGQNSPAVDAIKLSNPVSADQLRIVGIPDITPNLPEISPTSQSSHIQDLLGLLSQQSRSGVPTENDVPSSAAQAAQEYQQALRDRNAQGLTREALLRQAMDKRQEALSRINAERENSPLAWLGHIVSLLSAWRRREFNPSAAWSNATLAQAALDPEYQEAEDTIRLLAPQYATSQQNLENIQKSAFGADRLATDALNAAAYQQRVDNEERNTQARLLQAVDPYKGRSLEELQAMKKIFLKARAAQKTAAGQQKFDTVLKDIDRSIALKSQ